MSAYKWLAYTFYCDEPSCDEFHDTFDDGLEGRPH